MHAHIRPQNLTAAPEDPADRLNAWLYQWRKWQNFILHMWSLWFICRMIHLIGYLAKLHYKKTTTTQRYSGAILHRVREGPNGRILLMFGTDTCWLGLRYVISRVMHSVFAPELWLEQNLMQINQSSKLEKKKTIRTKGHKYRSFSWKLMRSFKDC